MSSIKSIKVLVNAHAGVGHDEYRLERLAQVFDKNGVSVDVSLAKTTAEMLELASDAARGPHEVIVAAGGDGTVNTVASALVDSDKILGVLPLGTLNHFARDMKIPFDIESAANVIMAGHTTDIDIGEANDRMFLNNSSLGLYPIIVRERNKRQRLGFRKWPAFVWAVIQAFRRYPFLDLLLRVEDEHLDLRTPFVFIGNNEYSMEGFNIGARDRLDRAMLSIYVTSRTSRLGLIKLALRALAGRLREEKDFLAMTSKEVKIETRHKRLRVALDGEVQVMQPPLRYRIRTRALRVLVPIERSSQ